MKKLYRLGIKTTLLASGITALFGLSGCATTSSTKAKALRAQKNTTDVTVCQHMTVLPFGVPANSKADPSTSTTFSQDIALRLKSDFGHLFESVETNTQTRHMDNECVLTGQITKYKPGNKVARAVLIGLGAASLEGIVKVTNATTNQELLVAPFDKLWAWGEIAGASKGMDDMMHEAAAATANTVARAKGWTPPAANGKGQH